VSDLTRSGTPRRARDAVAAVLEVHAPVYAADPDGAPVDAFRGCGCGWRPTRAAPPLSRFARWTHHAAGAVLVRLNWPGAR
jgi:hypothetical protein